jgi:hypothetical protein
MNHNFDRINFKLNELKNYINLMIFKNKIYITKYNDINNININIKKRNLSLNEIKKISNRGRNGNIIRKGIQFILDFIFLITEKVYTSQYLIRLKIKINNGFKFKSIMSVLPPAYNIDSESQVDSSNSLNQTKSSPYEKGGDESKSELASVNINNININQPNNIINILGSNNINNLIINMNLNYFPLGKSIVNQNLIASSPSNNLLDKDNLVSSSKAKEGSDKYYVNNYDNHNISKKRKIPFADSENIRHKPKKIKYIAFLDEKDEKRKKILNINSNIIYPHYGLLKIKDICKDVLDEMPRSYLYKEDKIMIKDLKANYSLVKFRNLISLPYHQRINLKYSDIILTLMEYVSIYNDSLLARNIIVNFIDT